MNPILTRLLPVWQPHPGQRLFLESESKVNVLACGRRWGKTDACAAKTTMALLRDSPTRHLLIAPTLDQAKILFDRTISLLGAVCEREGSKTPIKTAKTPYPKLKFGKHRLTARSGHLGHTLRGNEATHIIIDEAAFMPESVITEVAMPMLATTDGELTLISTPKGHNHFWRYFEMGMAGEHGVWSHKAPSSESPHVSPGFLELQRELISERAFRVEYEAEFLDSSGQVFDSQAIQECIVSPLGEVAPPFYIGVDWARYSDYTAVVVLAGSREDAKLVAADRFQGMSWAQQIQRVADIIHQWPSATVICDATGVGDPVIEMLRQEAPGTAIRSFLFTGQSKGPLIDGLAWLIEKRALKMEPHPELLRELQHFEAKTSDSGHVRLGAAGGFHDDLVIALSLATSILPQHYRPQIHLGKRRIFAKKRRK